MGCTYKARISWNDQNKKTRDRAIIREHSERQGGEAELASAQLNCVFMVKMELKLDYV